MFILASPSTFTLLFPSSNNAYIRLLQSTDAPISPYVSLKPQSHNLTLAQTRFSHPTPRISGDGYAHCSSRERTGLRSKVCCCCCCCCRHGGYIDRVHPFFPWSSSTSVIYHRNGVFTRLVSFLHTWILHNLCTSFVGSKVNALS